MEVLARRSNTRSIRYQRALETGYDLGLFDAKWFLDILESGGGKLHGTDVLVEGMSKTELADWIKKSTNRATALPGALDGARLVDPGCQDVERRSALGHRRVCPENGLVKDRFKADEGDEGVRVRSSD